MFYESDKIDTKFFCPLCNHRYDVPKALPCGESICERCVQMCIKKAESVKNDFKPEAINCLLCEEEHAIPRKGFPTQKILKELLDLQPTKVFRGVLFEKFEVGLQTLNSDLERFKEFIDEADSKIKNHCDFIREDVDIYIESMIDELHKLRAKIWSDVDSFEKSSFESLSVKKNEVYGVLSEVKTKHSEYELALKKTDLDKDVLKNLVNETNGLIVKLQKSKNDLEELLQKGRLICFRASKFKFKQSYVGELNYNGVQGELEDVDESEYYETGDDEKKDDVWSEVEENENQVAEPAARIPVPRPRGYKIHKVKIKNIKKKEDPCAQQ